MSRLPFDPEDEASSAEIARHREEDHLRGLEKARRSARWRILVIMGCVALAYGGVSYKLAHVVGSDPIVSGYRGSTETIRSERADIVDRNGDLLAVNVPTWSLYATPQEIVYPSRAAAGLAEIFPDLDAEALERRFTDGRKFMWLRKSITPEQRLAVHDIGEPGLRFGDREMRVYPNGRTAAHVLGGSTFGRESVRAAEVLGVAGIEHELDSRLRDEALSSQPLRLSIDIGVQRAFAQELRSGMALYGARGAAGILMRADTGEVISMVSLPDFDPNDRPIATGSVKAEDFPTFNRAAQGLYELGSTFKIFTAAMVLEDNLASMGTMFDTEGPIRRNGFRIGDAHKMDPRMSLRDVIVESSNVGTVHLVELAGMKRQQDLLRRLGFLDPVAIELTESHGRPEIPDPWREINMITISYGHGLSASPLHLASAYATMVNGGLRVRPTLLADPEPPTEADRVISAKTSDQVRQLMRAVVAEGTGSKADPVGYFVGGKTGTAEKVENGRYNRRKVVATFAGAFPIDDPDYVVVVTYDEAAHQSEWGPMRSAGWTAAPTVGKVVERVSPLLGLRPRPYETDVTLEASRVD